MATEKKKLGRKPKSEVPEAIRQQIVNTVSEYYIKAYGFRMIAEKVKEIHGVDMSHTMARNHVLKLREEWKRERIHNMDEAKNVELQRIDRLETTYWEAWERSIEKLKKTKDKQRATPRRTDGGGTEMSVLTADKEVMTEERLGDPRYLEGVRWCIQKRCEIMGLDAPMSANINHSGTIVNRTTFKTKVRRPQI